MRTKTDKPLLIFTGYVELFQVSLSNDESISICAVVENSLKLH